MVITENTAKLRRNMVPSDIIVLNFMRTSYRYSFLRLCIVLCVYLESFSFVYFNVVCIDIIISKYGKRNMISFSL